MIINNIIIQLERIDGGMVQVLVCRLALGKWELEMEQEPLDIAVALIVTQRILQGHSL